MKKIKLTFLISTTLCAVALSASADVALVQNNQAQATIYVSKTSRAGHIEAVPSIQSSRFHPPVNPFTLKVEKVLPLQTAVEELNYHLQKMSGAKLPVVRTDNPADVRGNAIVLGELAVKMGATLQNRSVSGESFRLLTKGKTFLIGSETDDGALFGTYRLLRALGCDWVMPGAVGEVIPRQSTVNAPSMDEVSIPGFPVRVRWSSPRFSNAQDLLLTAQWLRRSGKGDYYPPAFNAGAHYWDKFIKKHQKDFDADASMYALVREPSGNLVRKGPQIETTHPKVLELMVEDIGQEFEENGWPHDKEVGFPFLGPADSQPLSVSADSQNAGGGYIDPLSGSTDSTDLVVLLGNQILEKIKKEYPNVWLGFYSYSDYQDYPRRYKPDPRLVVVFAPLQFGPYHSAIDPHSKTQAYYRDVLEKWSEISKQQGNPLIYRGYNFKAIELFSPFTKLGIWKDEIPLYHQMGFLGLNVEAFNNWANFGLSDYMLMQLAWNPNADWEKTFKSYCRNSFGAGAPDMEKYFLRLMQRQSEAGQEAATFDALHLIYTPEFVLESKKDLQAAMNAAQSNDEKTRIAYATEGFKSLEIYLAYHQATLEFDFPKAKTIFEQLIAHQNAMMSTNSLMATTYTTHQLTRFLKDFSATAAQYSTGEYQVVYKLPDQLATSIDSYRAGETMRFFSPSLKDENWLRTKTYSTTWDDQAMTLPKSGSVWYRHRFDATKPAANESVGLMLGGYNDTARVWLNGEKLLPLNPPPVYGGLMKPAVYDLTAALKAGGDNLLAIEIQKNSAADFYGVGGLTRPSFVFKGPKLLAATK